MFGHRKRQSSSLSNPSEMAGNLDEEETKAKKKSLSRVRRLFSFSSGTKAEDQTANDPPGTNRFRRHTLSAGTDTHQDSSGSTGQPASSPGKYTFDFPSPENVGQVRRLRTNIITGAESDPAKSLPASRSDSTALFKTSDKEHKITPNLSEKELMKAMPPLIRDIYDNKCDQFTHELKSALKTSGKKQTPIVFQIVDKHHKRNIFHWIALLNRQNIAKAAVDTINNRQIVDYLLSAIDRDGRTPLHLAAIHQHMLMVRMCLNLSLLSGNAVDKLGMTALAYAVECGGDISVCTALLAKGQDPNSRDSDGLPILYRAIHMKNEPVALALINGGANVNLRNSESKTPLHLAVSIQSKILVQALLAHDADTSVRDVNGDTPTNIAEIIYGELIQRKGGLPESVWNPKGLPVPAIEIHNIINNQNKENNTEKTTIVTQISTEEGGSTTNAGCQNVGNLPEIVEQESKEETDANLIAGISNGSITDKKSVDGAESNPKKSIDSELFDKKNQDDFDVISKLQGPTIDLPIEDYSSRSDEIIPVFPAKKQKDTPAEESSAMVSVKPVDDTRIRKVLYETNIIKESANCSNIEISSSVIRHIVHNTDEAEVKKLSVATENHPISSQAVDDDAEKRGTKSTYSSNSDISFEIEMIKARLAREIASRKFFEGALDESKTVIESYQTELKRKECRIDELEAVDQGLIEEIEVLKSELAAKQLTLENNVLLSAELVPNLEHKIIKLQQEKTSVLEALNVESTLRRDCEKEAKQLRSEMKIMERKLLTERESNSTLKREITVLREVEAENDYIQLLRDRLEEEFELRKQLEEENDRSQKILSEMEHDIAEIRLLYEEEVKGNERLRVQKESSEQNFQSVSTVAISANAQLSVLQQVIDDQKAIIKELGEEKAKLLDDKNQLLSDFTVIRGELNEDRQKILELSAEKLSKEGEICEFRQHVESLTNSLTNSQKMTNAALKAASHELSEEKQKDHELNREELNEREKNELEGKLADSKRRLEQFASENNELSKELALVKEQHEISIKIAEKEVAALLEAKEKGLQQEKEQLAIELKTLQISHSELKKNLFATEEDLKEQRSNLERTRRQSEVETFQFQKKTNQEKSRLMEDLMKANLEAIDLKSKLTELQVSQEKEKRTYSQRLSELENEWQNKLTTVQLEFTRLSADHNRLKKHAAILEDELAESKILHQNVETAIVNLLKNISLEISKINSNDQLQMSCNAPESLPFSPFVALARVFDSFKIMIGLYNDCDSNLEAHKKRLAQTEKNYDILSLTAEKLKQSISITQASEKELIGKLESEYGAKIAAERINDDFFVLIEKFIAETPLHTDEIIKMQGKNFLGDDNVKGLVQIGELCKILHNSVGTVPVFTQIWKNFLIDNGGRSISKRFEKVIDQILLVVDQSLKTPVDIVRHTARAIESVAEKSIVDLTKLEKQLVAKAEESELVKAMVEGVNRDILLVNKLIAILESSHLTLIKLSMQDLDQNTCNAIQNSLKKLDDVPKRELGIANSTTPADLTQAPLMAKIAFEKLSDLIITERNLWRNFSDASNSLLDRHRTEINRLRTALSETTVHAKKMNDFLRENISASIAFRAFQETISMLNQERSITDVMRVEIFKKTEDAYRKNFDELLVDLNALKAFVIKVLRENERLEKEIAYQQLETSRQSRKDADKQLAELRVLFRIKGRLP